MLTGPAPAWAQLPGLGGTATRHIEASLIAEDMRPSPGSTVTVAVVMRPEPGWHGYWQNPGDAGKPLNLQWDLPSGVEVSVPRYPVPETLLTSGLMNHVYKGSYAVLFDVKLPGELKPGARLPFRAHADWLVCSDSLCVPEQAELALDLTVGAEAGGSPENRAVFDGYRQKLPRPLGGEALFEKVRAGSARLVIPYPASAALDDPHFFSLAEGAKSYAAPQTWARDGDRLFVTIADAPPSGATFDGILRIGPDMGLQVSARPGAVPDAGNIVGVDNGWRAVLLALAGAIAGGLLLNIMPCVFPILSLKAMSLIRSAASASDARHEAWAYTAGVMLSCVGLGGAVLLARAGGEAVGWAFQLQNPAVILMLLGLSVAIALNLIGLYRLTPLHVDGSLSTGKGLRADFWSGVLIAFVATPCTGPFMATALGAALLLPVGAALAIFAGLGLGLALPFLALAHLPALRNAMPRPGPWMEKMRRWLALPMALTALALLWLLWRQVGVSGLALGLMASLGAAIFLWWLGRRQANGDARAAGALVALACLLLFAASAFGLAQIDRSATGSGSSGGDVRFSDKALAEARASGKPVFLYFTADWCLTCKVNEAAAIDRAEVRAVFERSGVTTMVGDWTDGDPAITRFLESHGRSGVPLYLWYPENGGRPAELPQILTPSLLIERAGGSP